MSFDWKKKEKVTIRYVFISSSFNTNRIFNMFVFLVLFIETLWNIINLNGEKNGHFVSIDGKKKKRETLLNSFFYSTLLADVITYIVSYSFSHVAFWFVTIRFTNFSSFHFHFVFHFICVHSFWFARRSIYIENKTTTTKQERGRGKGMPLCSIFVCLPFQS